MLFCMQAPYICACGRTDILLRYEDCDIVIAGRLVGRIGCYGDFAQGCFYCLYFIESLYFEALVGICSCAVEVG